MSKMLLIVFQIVGKQTKLLKKWLAEMNFLQN